MPPKVLVQKASGCPCSIVVSKSRATFFMGSPNLPIIPQTINPTNVGLDVVEMVILFNHNHSYPVLPLNLQYRMDMVDRVGCLKS